MSDTEPKADRPVRRRALRWAGRGSYWLGWLLAVVCSVLLLLGAVLWWAHGHATEVAQLGLGLFEPDGSVRIDEVNLSKPGQLAVRGVAMSEGVTIDEVLIDYTGAGWSWWKLGQVETLTVRGGKLRLDDALLGNRQAEGQEESVAGSDSGLFPDWLSRLVPENVVLDRVDLEVDAEGVPQISGTVSVAVNEVRGLLAGETGVRVDSVKLENAVWKAEGAPDPVSFERFEAAVDIAPGFSKIAVHEAKLTGLKADLTREGLALFLDAPKNDDESASELPEIVIDRFSAEDAELSFSGLEQMGGLRGAKVTMDFEIGDLVFADGRLRSAVEQSLVIGRAEIFAQAVDLTDTPPLVAWDRVELRAVPDDLLDRGAVAKVKLDGLQVNVSKATLGSLWDQFEGGAVDDVEAPATAAASAPERPVLIIDDLSVAGATLNFDPEGLVSGIPAATAHLEMRSEGVASDGDVKYAVELTELEVREKVGSTKAFAKGAKIAAEFRGLGLQRDGLIDGVTLSGVRVDVAEEVARLAEQAMAGGSDKQDAGAASPEPDIEVTGDMPELSIAELKIVDTAITLHDLIPAALPVLTIGIDTSLENIPLLGRSRGDEKEQRIELKGITIASQSNSLINVAELETVWIHFTIPGLFRNEINRVEIAGPSVYIGEPLFWYIDYIRKMADSEPAAGPAGDAVPPPPPDTAAADENAIVEGLKGFEISGWKIGAIEAHTGKIIIAPTGTPLGIVPFPFQAKTDFTKGEISLEVEVPTGDYVFEQLELELRDLWGTAFVNYPVAGVDNNFVQTFKSPSVKFKQFEGTEAWVSVTYDQNGIYGQLGGEAYEGYVEGAFNLYIDGPYKWDAWVSGTGFDLGAFTEVLAPGSFKMKGVIDGKFVAEGQEFDITKATGEVATRGGGMMHVIKLDDLREALPEDWDPLWKAISNAGIDAFRDYPFATGKADVQYEDGEGEARIAFDGDQGKRDLKLRLLDRKGGRAKLADAPPHVE